MSEGTRVLAPDTVPCGIHTIIPGTKGESVACGGTCEVTSRTDTLVYYTCERCGWRTARNADGSPLRAWDGVLRDGSRYEDAAPSEHDWRL